MRLRAGHDEAEWRLRAALDQRGLNGTARSLLSEPSPAERAMEPAGSIPPVASAPADGATGLRASQQGSPAVPGGATGDTRKAAGVLLAALPAPLRHGVVDPRRRGVLALVLLALVGAGAAGTVAWRARPRAVVVPRQPQRTASAVPRAAGANPGSSAGPVVVVEVAGAVRRPGLQRLPAGSRVADAVAAAGGVRPGTSTAGLNLARKLADGEQVVVGGLRPVAAQQSVGPAGAASSGGPVDLNAATLADLDRVSGVGPVLAQRILDWRDQHGGFTSVDQLREVDGIGDRKFASLRAQVTV